LRDSTYVSWECLKRSKHVEPVEVDNASRHSVVAEFHLCPTLYDKSCSFLAIATFRRVINAISERR